MKDWPYTFGEPATLWTGIVFVGAGAWHHSLWIVGAGVGLLALWEASRKAIERRRPQ